MLGPQSLSDARDVLQLAHEHVRSRTRTRKYFEHADRFAAAFLGKPLGVSPHYYTTAGTDVPAVLDTCYEHFLPEGEAAAPILKHITARLHEMLDVPSARRALPALRASLEQPACPLLDVASGLLAAIATLGHATITQKASTEIADRWLSLWRTLVWKHNHQQELHGGLCLLPPLSAAARARVLSTLAISPADLHPKATTFAGGVSEYLATFSDTAAAAMALVGALPFAESPSGSELSALLAFLTDTPELLALMNEALRLSQDVRFDPSEPLSTGVFALAAEQGSSVADLDATQLPAADLETKLQREWTISGQVRRARMENLLATLPHGEALQGSLSDVVATTWLIADALTSAPHKG